jgi:hypothetical protein
MVILEEMGTIFLCTTGLFCFTELLWGLMIGAEDETGIVV